MADFVNSHSADELRTGYVERLSSGADRHRRHAQHGRGFGLGLDEQQ